MFADGLSKGITARSFGGLRMTNSGWNVCKRPPKLIVILRPPKDLAVLALYSDNVTKKTHYFFSEVQEDIWSESATARSFGGLRMTVKKGGVIPRRTPHHCHPEASEGSGCYAF